GRGVQLAPGILSDKSRNFLGSAKVGMSAVMGLSPLALEPTPPRVICGWTPRPLSAILPRAIGRIGLRRSATRAPGGRRYASGPGFLRGTWPDLFPPGVGRQGGKLRGSGGRAPRAAPQRHLRVLQIPLPKAQRHGPVQ